MADESKPVDPAAEQAAQTLASMAETKAPTVESDGDSEHDDAHPAAGSVAASEAAKKKKKKSKRKKIKEALSGNAQTDIQKAIGGLTPQQISELVQLNPALAQELASEGKGEAGSSSIGGGVDHASAVEALKRLNLDDIMTGLASSGKNVKDMASYKFWSTQPVMKFGESQDKLVEEGPLSTQNIEDVPKEPAPLGVPGFEWVTMDLTQESQLKEVYELLNGHYVEDDEAMFRFKYSTSILQW
jgi:glycylpeptide N-tetradecanoyltransferase